MNKDISFSMIKIDHSGIELSTISQKEEDRKQPEFVSHETKSSTEYITEFEQGNESNYEMYKLKEGKKHGRAFKYSNNEIKEEVEYCDGEIVWKVKEFSGSEMVEYNEEGIKCYQGSFTNNKLSYLRDGRGKEYNNNAVCYIGQWVNGNKQGEGKSYKDGRIYYSGEWYENLPNGKGCLYGENGSNLYDGFWRHGQIRINNNQSFCYSTGLIVETKVESINAFVRSIEELCNLSVFVTSLRIGKGCCNKLESFNFSIFTVLHTLIIDESSFMNVSTVQFKGMHDLKSIRIGPHCFQNTEEMERSACLLQNCSILEEFVVGEKSFINYFLLHFESSPYTYLLLDLPMLRSLQVGTINKVSSCFSTGSFRLKGTYFFKCFIDLPALETVIIGDESFLDTNRILFESISIFVCK